MKTLLKDITATCEIKQSRFIAFLLPYSRFEQTLRSLKAAHPKARHFVTAFRYRNSYGQVVEGSSDDGEPKGTSGKPSLAVLQGADLMECAVIIVRYFGGTKLGTGGLVRAYTRAVHAAVTAAELSPCVPMQQAVFSCGYGNIGRVEHLLAGCGVTVVQKRFEAEEVLWSVEAASETLEIFFATAGRLLRRK